MNVGKAEKLNSGYIMRPISFFKDALTHTAGKIRGYLYTFGLTPEGVAIGYKGLCDKLGTSRSSVWRAVFAEKERGDFDIQREGGKATRYTYLKGNPKEFSVRTELYFYTEKFNVHDVVRYLTDAEVDVLSLIYTWTRYEKVKKYTGNYGDIARTLHLDYYTVMRAISALFSAGVISRPCKGRNDHKKSEYVANIKRLRALEKLNKKQGKEEKGQKIAAKEATDANARADRDRFYALRREKAKLVADRNVERVNKNPEIREISKRLAVMEIELARAELSAPLTLPDLQATKIRLIADRERLLAKMGLTSVDLKPRWACQKCSDTGALPDGRACDCYLLYNKGGGNT